MHILRHSVNIGNYTCLIHNYMNESIEYDEKV